MELVEALTGACPWVPDDRGLVTVTRLSPERRPPGGGWTGPLPSSLAPDGSRTSRQRPSSAGRRPLTAALSRSVTAGRTCSGTTGRSLVDVRPGK